MAQIIQVCNKLLVLFIILLNFEVVKSDIRESSYYGSFLSWNHAKQNSDSYNLKKFLYEIDLDQIDKNFYEGKIIIAPPSISKNIIPPSISISPFYVLVFFYSRYCI